MGPEDKLAPYGVMLRAIRRALMGDAENLGTPEQSSPERVRAIRERTSATVGLVVALLNEAGFEDSEILYSIRDSLAAGHSIGPEELSWLELAIESATHRPAPS